MRDIESITNIEKADSDLHIEIPEGIALLQPLAAPTTRFMAYFIDILIIGLLFFISTIIFTLIFSGRAGTGVLLIVYFLIYWGYFIFLEMITDGQSIGKKLYKIRVVQSDFTPLSIQSSIIRNLLRVADFFPVFYGVGVFFILFSKSSQRIGDLAASTVVVSYDNRVFIRSKRRKNKAKKVNFWDTKNLNIDQPAKRLPIILTNEEKASIVNFAIYYNRGSLERAKEIAKPLADIFKQKNLDVLTNDLCGYAKWILGENDLAGKNNSNNLNKQS